MADGSSSLAEVVKFMQARDLTLGFAGVYFTNIQLYLKRHGYPTKLHMIKLQGNIDKKIKESRHKIAILAYKHSKCGHYIAIKYHSDKKEFEVHNPDCTPFSVDYWMWKRSKPYVPLCLITI